MKQNYDIEDKVSELNGEKVIKYVDNFLDKQEQQKQPYIDEPKRLIITYKPGPSLVFKV